MLHPEGRGFELTDRLPYGTTQSTSSDIHLLRQDAVEQQSPVWRSYPISDPTLVPSSPAEPINLAKEFSPHKQRLKLLWKGLLLWMVTAVLLVLYGMTIWGYQQGRKPVMTKSEKNVFNTITTGLSIALGLSIAAALNEMTLNMRWWFLSQKKRTLRETEVILKSNVSSLTSYFITPHPWATVPVVLWLIINIGAQIGIASLGLLYSIDGEVNTILLEDGNVVTSNITTFFPPRISGEPLQTAAEYTANVFGNMAVFLIEDDINKAPEEGASYYHVNASIWKTPQHQDNPYWFYRFLSYPSGDIESAVASPGSMYDNRSVQACWSCHEKYTVELPGGNGSNSNIVVNYHTNNGDRKLNVTVPSVDPTKKTFFTDFGVTCGSRCAVLYVFEPDDNNPFYYNCNITVSNVFNATLDGHKISDKMAVMAARAIAVGGSSLQSPRYKTARPFQMYPKDSVYGLGAGQSSYEMGQNIARFTIGAISMADIYNPRFSLPGQEPKAGLSLSISKLTTLIIIFSLVAGLQAIFFLVTTFIANHVVVPDDSPFVMARLLGPIVAQLPENAGSISTGEEICKALGNQQVVYSVRRPEKTMGETMYRTVLGDEKLERAMPAGLYE